MKTILSFALLLCFANSLTAQTDELEVPKTIKNVAYFSDSLEKWINLELQTVKSYDYVEKSDSGKKNKITRYEVDSCCSSNIIEQKTQLKFIITIENNVIDPEMLIEILKLNKDKNKRFIDFKSYKKNQFADIVSVKFNGGKNGETSYNIEIPKIESGEYAITIRGKFNQLHLFQIR
jgi:hypothetical protein